MRWACSGHDQVRWLFMLTLVLTLVVNPLPGWLVGRFRRPVFISATRLLLLSTWCCSWGLIVFSRPSG